MDLGLPGELLVGPCHSAHLTYRAPVHSAHRSAGERITASPGTPERNKAEPDVTGKGHLRAIGITVVLPQVCNPSALSALTRPVKGAWRGYDVAPIHGI